MSAPRSRAALAAALLLALAAAVPPPLAAAPAPARLLPVSAAPGRPNAPLVPASPALTDSARLDTYISLSTLPACRGDSLVLVLMEGCRVCAGVQGDWQVTGPASARIDVQLRPGSSFCSGVGCPSTMIPLAHSVRLSPEPAGSGVVFVTVHVTVAADSLAPEHAFDLNRWVPYVVSDTCVVPPNPVGLPYGMQVTLLGSSAACDTCVPHVCSTVPVRVHVSGLLPNGCFSFRGAELLPTFNIGDPPTIAVRFRNSCANICPLFVTPFEATVTLAPPATGTQTFQVRAFENVCPDTFGVVRAIANFAYVGDSCVGVGEPPNGLQYVSSVELVGATAACDSCTPRVCLGDSLRVRIRGGVTAQCMQFLGATRVPDPIATGPFIVQLGFRNLCDRPCGMTAARVPFDTLLTLGLPGSRRALRLDAVMNTCPDSTLAWAGSRAYGFAADSCSGQPPAHGCVDPFLIAVPVMGALTDGCNLRLPPGGRGEQGFAVRSDRVALAGLQGHVQAGGSARILGLHALGPAAAMHLLTRPDSTGGLWFVLYGDGGPVIPAAYYDPVLAVSVKADSAAHPGDSGTVGCIVTAASDGSGASLPICTVDTFAPVVAHVCVVAPVDCDANGDGVTNVADLVRMARCWAHPGTCPDSAAARPDCNGDGVFGAADILCCARAILGGGPHDSTHVAPGLRVTLGSPTLDGPLVHVPLVIQGATAMNGALLHLTFPGDRFTMRQPGWPEPNAYSTAAPWLPLVQPGDGDGVVGLLRLDDAASDDITVSLVLEIKPGQSAGGTLRVDQGDLMAPDGSALAVDLTHLAANLPVTGAAGTPITRVELACGPNPAGGSTRFVVRLPQAATVDLGIYDLAGRRIETLAHGALAAGETSFAWSGAGRTGLYFARLAVNGLVRTTRVTMQLSR